ncbi:MAG: LacI family DNA-binding transcriptional regulator [Nitriliruptoraceae bacterium]
MAKVTLKDVAAKAGVHVSTASRALDPTKGSLVRDDTVLRVRAAAEELGYQGDAVASGLRRGRTNTLGVVVADLGNPYIAAVARGIENHLDDRGLMALIAESRDDTARMSRVLDNLAARRVDAVIVTGARTGDERALLRAQQRMPVVLAVRHLPGSGIPAITHDDELGGRMAAEHLLQHGHRRVAQLRGPAEVSSFRERGAGFRRPFEERGIVIIEVDDDAERPVLLEGRRLMELLLAQHRVRPTAIFAHNDLMAFGALQALADHGLSCPEDVAIVGYNDTPMTAFTDPPITTVRLPGYELGRMAADTAVRLIDDHGDPGTLVSLSPVLVPRRSTLGWHPAS